MTKIICVVNDEVMEGSGLKKEHGVSFWIEMQHANVLFDTGQSPEVLSHNLQVLGLIPINIDALVFSHAHYDHTGGVAAIFPERTTIPLYANSDLFRARYSSKDDVYKSIGMTMKESDLSHYFYLKLSDDPVEVKPGLWTTGTILERPERMGISKHHMVHTQAGWEHDPYQDDLSLELKTSAGNVLICGCCHAGILNTLYHTEKVFGGPIIGVIGGTHLISADDQYLDHIVDVFQDRYPDCNFYLNHCTGKNVLERLTEKLGDRIQMFPAGSAVEFPE
jgi:7,8-dihydropterin-6-yl-methyl-4-(beta-D-ribofuranosyl)aminobenzene 5'-phosphate synthase